MKKLFSSVQFSHSVVSDYLWPHGLQHARPGPPPTPGDYSNSCPLSRWCHPTISSCHPLLLSPSIFPSIRDFKMSQLFASGGQSIGVSVSASVLSMNIQDWFLLGWTSWISLQSKELSRVFSNTTVQKHQFVGMGREEGGGFGMGNTCIPVADSFWYLAKLIQLCKD